MNSKSSPSKYHRIAGERLGIYTGSKQPRTCLHERTGVIRYSTMELHATIINMLKQRVSARSIWNKWQKIYHGTLDISVLYCFAVYYECWGLLRRFMKAEHSFSDYNPLLTAIQCRKLEAIKACLTCRHAGEEGYGIIKNNKILTDKKCSALYIIFHADSCTLLDYVLRMVTVEKEVLVELAIKHGAMAIYNYLNLFCFAMNVNVPHMKRLMSYVCTGYGLVTYTQFLCALNLWSSVQKNYPPANKPLSDDKIRSINKVLFDSEENELVFTSKRVSTYSMLAEACFRHYVAALDNEGPLTIPVILHTMVIVHTCQMLLHQLKAPSKDYRVDTIHMINSKVDQIRFHCFSRATPSYVISSMDCICKLAKLVAQCGYIRDLSWTEHIIKTDQQFVSPRQVNCAVSKYMWTILAYRLPAKDGYFGIDYDEHADIVIPFVEARTNLKNHATFEEYRVKYQWRYKDLAMDNLIREETKPSPDKDKIRVLTHIIANFPDDGPRSLLELCRVKMYRLVPKNAMPTVAKKLHLSHDLKKMLTFGVTCL